MLCGMYRTPIGSIIEQIRELKQGLDSEVNDMTKLLAKTDPETYSRFLRYTYGNYEVVDTPDHIKTEIDNFDFSKIGHLKKEDLSGKCITFIFMMDGMCTAEFAIPYEFANNFNYVRAWASGKVQRKEQLSELEKEFKKET